MTDIIDKDRFEPAYAQLAAILRRQIAEGIYPPGEKIPSEAEISRQHGISPMTVRQAINLLAGQGLLKRVQGSGTYVKPIDLTGSRFDLDSLREIFLDSNRTQVKVLEIALEQAGPETASALSLPIEARVILIRRLLLREGRPVIFHEGRIRCDPKRPVVEAELELGPLSDLFSPQGQRMVKKGRLELVPTALGAMEAAALERPQGTSVFRIAYVFYDFGDIPVGCGWFTAPPEVIRLETRLGLWEED